MSVSHFQYVKQNGMLTEGWDIYIQIFIFELGQFGSVQS